MQMESCRDCLNLDDRRDIDKVALILRPSNVEKAEQMLTANGVVILSLGEIKKYFQ